MNLVGKKTSCLVMYTHIVFNNIYVFAWIETLEVHIVLKKYSLVYVKGVPDEIQTSLFRFSLQLLIFERPFNCEGVFAALALPTRQRGIV
jgi:hypothetical protein